MMAALVALGALSAVELLMYAPLVWRAHRPLAVVLVILLAFDSGALFAANMSICGGLVLLVALYRIFNLLRVAGGQRQTEYLRRKAFLTTWSLLLYQAVLLAAEWGFSLVHASRYTALITWALATLVFALVLLASTLRNLRHTIAPAVTNNFSDKELPSISVCIPARNETAALEACLRSLIASDYPKLEILVLDDCSQDRTAEIIRSFAHDGVRFIAGVEPSGSWLAKNWAYQQLSEEANGELLVFCGVDITWGVGALRALVTTMLHKRKAMMCVIPTNRVQSGQGIRFSTLLQPIRYAWEMCLPRRRFQRPPILSSCWIVRRELLQQSGGFAADTNSIAPEGNLARAAARRDGYSFVRSDTSVTAVSQKLARDQWDTTLRTRYPQLRRRPELVLLLTAIQCGGLLAPLGIFIGSCVAGSWVLAAVSGIASALLLFVYCLVVRLTYRRFLWRSLILGPIAVLLSIILQHYSMERYEFSDVLWKGRNVCIPVMQVIPQLPKLQSNPSHVN